LALQTLLVQNFRIIEQLDISLAQNANLFIGENGAGKTSILEAVDVLSRGRSFREHRTATLIRRPAEDLVVSGHVTSESASTHLGIQKTAKQTTLHCNQEKVASITEHANCLPVLSMHPDSHQLIQGGGKYRRNYLDWSAFHVKQGFLKAWRAYSKCLKQRNQALRDHCDEQQLGVWTHQISLLGEQVNIARSQIFQEVIGVFLDYIDKLLPECKISMTYKQGWPEELNLAQALHDAHERERSRKTTSYRPHRGDLKLYLNDQEASASASRGQQKLIAAALLLAQIEHVQQHSNQKCVVLLDDVRAELDQQHSTALLEALQTLGCQVLITALEREQVDLTGWQNTKVFHVKQGVCEALKDR